MLNRRKVLRDGMILLAAGTAGCAAPQAAAPTAAAGSVVWKYKVDGQLRRLRYGSGRLVVASDTALIGLDGQTGGEVWRLPIVVSGDHLEIADGILYVCGGEPNAKGDRVSAVDLVSGQRKWAFDAPAGSTLNGAYGIRDGVCFLVASNDDKHGHEVWALDTTTRTVRWQVPASADRLHVPATGTLLYSFGPDGGSLSALDAAGNGDLAWSRADDPSVHSSTLRSGLVGGLILASDGSTVFGLDPKTGAAQWTTPTLPYPTGVFFSSPDAYYLSDGAKLYALTPGGEATRLWSQTLTEQNPALTGHTTPTALYLLTGKTLRAMDIRTGLLRWTQDAPGSDIPFAVGDAHCYLQSPEGPDESAVAAIAR